MQYLIVIEKAENNYSAFLPDVPGCVATGKTIDETLQIMEEALVFHLEGMLEEGEQIPSANTLRAHLDKGTFNPENIGATFIIGNISVDEQKIAA